MALSSKYQDDCDHGDIDLVSPRSIPQPNHLHLYYTGHGHDQSDPEQGTLLASQEHTKVLYSLYWVFWGGVQKKEVKKGKIVVTDAQSKVVQDRSILIKVKHWTIDKSR